MRVGLWILVAVVLLLTGCLFRWRPSRLPSSEEYLAQAEEVVKEHVERAETQGEKVHVLARVFTFYSDLGSDYPEDRGRVGEFLADFLMPSFLRALDAAKRDVGNEGAVGLQIVVGVILVNDYAMEKWHSVIEDRLLEGESGLVNLYWPRDRRADFPAEQCKSSVARYKSLLERCVARGAGCSDDVRQSIRNIIRDYPPRCREAASARSGPPD